jgi:hypothetical protein
MPSFRHLFGKRWQSAFLGKVLCPGGYTFEVVPQLLNVCMDTVTDTAFVQ